MKILVTGGSGFVCSHTVAPLLKSGHTVRLARRSASRRRSHRSVSKRTARCASRSAYSRVGALRLLPFFALFSGAKPVDQRLEQRVPRDRVEVLQDGLQLDRADETGEDLHHERPDLVIIDPALWDRVQERVAERSAESRKLPRVHAGHDPSALSHLLICGACRSRMSIAGGSKKGSRRWKCSANHSKGPEICANGQSISDGKLMAALAETLRQCLTEPCYYKRLAASVKDLWPVVVGGLHPAPGPDLLDEEARRQEAKVDRLAALVAGNGDIEALLRRLRAEEATLRDLRARRAAPAPRRPARRRPSRPPRRGCASSGRTWRARCGPRRGRRSRRSRRGWH